VDEFTMLRRTTREPAMADLLDRILDKGIVIDVWARVILAGVDLGIRWEARVVVASIDTYLKYAGPIKYTRPIGLLGQI
jgi:gas vesicle structural protein